MKAKCSPDAADSENRFLGLRLFSHRSKKKKKKWNVQSFYLVWGKEATELFLQSLSYFCFLVFISFHLFFFLFFLYVKVQVGRRIHVIKTVERTGGIWSNSVGYFVKSISQHISYFSTSILSCLTRSNALTLFSFWHFKGTSAAFTRYTSTTNAAFLLKSDYEELLRIHQTVMCFPLIINNL